jgi:hypothetical protein
MKKTDQLTVTVPVMFAMIFAVICYSGMLQRSAVLPRPSRLLRLPVQVTVTVPVICVGWLLQW